MIPPQRASSRSAADSSGATAAVAEDLGWAPILSGCGARCLLRPYWYSSHPIATDGVVFIAYLAYYVSGNHTLLMLS